MTKKWISNKKVEHVWINTTRMTVKKTSNIRKCFLVFYGSVGGDGIICFLKPTKS